MNQDLSTALSETATEIRDAISRVLTAAAQQTTAEAASMLVGLIRVRDTTLKLCCRRQRAIPPVTGLLARMPCDTQKNATQARATKAQSAAAQQRKAARLAAEQQTAADTAKGEAGNV